MKTLWHTSEDLISIGIQSRIERLRFVIFYIIFILLGAEGRYYLLDDSLLFIILGGVGLIGFIDVIYYYNWGWRFGEKAAKIIQNIQPVENSVTLKCFIQSGKMHDYNKISENNNSWYIDIEILNSVNNKFSYELIIPFKFREKMLHDYLPKLYSLDRQTIDFEFKNVLIYFDPSTPKLIVIRLPEYGLLVGRMNYFQKIKYK